MFLFGLGGLNPDRLGKDLKLILKQCGTARLIVGELGFDRGRDPAKDYGKAVAVLKKFPKEIVAVYFWEAFQPGFGIFGTDGRAVWPGAVSAMTH